MSDLNNWLRGDPTAPPHVKEFWLREDLATQPEVSEEEGISYWWDHLTGKWWQFFSPEHFDLRMQLSVYEMPYQKAPLTAIEVAEAEALAARIKELEEA